MSTDQGQMYGRGAALAAVTEELRRLVDGRGTVVIFEGGAGMGKSRMLAEVARIGRRIGLTTCVRPVSGSTGRRFGTSSHCSSNGGPRRSLRPSPAWFRSSQPPSDADREQAAVFAVLLASMIASGDEQLSALDYAAERAHFHDRPNLAFRLRRQAR